MDSWHSNQLRYNDFSLENYCSNSWNPRTSSRTYLLSHIPAFVETIYGQLKVTKPLYAKLTRGQKKVAIRQNFGGRSKEDDEENKLIMMSDEGVFDYLSKWAGEVRDKMGSRTRKEYEERLRIVSHQWIGLQYLGKSVIGLHASVLSLLAIDYHSPPLFGSDPLLHDESRPPLLSQYPDPRHPTRDYSQYLVKARNNWMKDVYRESEEGTSFPADFRRHKNATASPASPHVPIERDVLSGTLELGQAIH